MRQCTSLHKQVIYYNGWSGCSLTWLLMILRLFRTMWQIFWSSSGILNLTHSLHINPPTSVYALLPRSSRSVFHTLFFISFSFSSFQRRFPFLLSPSLSSFSFGFSLLWLLHVPYGFIFWLIFLAGSPLHAWWDGKDSQDAAPELRPK